MENLTEYMKNHLKPETFVDMLFRLADAHGISDVELYKRAGFDRRFFSKIRSDAEYKPKKRNVCALALALELDNATAKQLIKKAGYILTSANRFDLTIRYCFENRIYDLFAVNELLAEQGLPPLTINSV